MKTKINQIQINHPQLGPIVINSTIDEETNKLIGTITNDYATYPNYYHAKIFRNEDKTFAIKDLGIIRPEKIIVGKMKTSFGSKNSVKIIVNRKVGEDITVYPSGVFSVIYEEI